MLEPRGGVTTPWRLHSRVSRTKGHPGARELLGWSLPDGGVSEIDAGMNSSEGLAWGREGRLYLPRLPPEQPQYRGFPEAGSVQAQMQVGYSCAQSRGQRAP